MTTETIPAEYKTVKQRVMGRNGHLSNDLACNFLRETLDSRTSTLILGHLSEHNNHPEIVRLMASQMLEHRCLDPHLVVAQPGSATEAFVY